MLLKKEYIFIFVLILTPVLPALFLSPSVKIEPQKNDKDPFRKTMEELIGENILWVDARSREKYEARHVPGAVLINSINWDSGLDRLFGVFEPGQTVVVYCNKGCSESKSVSARLRVALGQENVFYLEGGIDAWFLKNQ